MPRPDSEPVFGKLLDPLGGSFAIELVGGGNPKSRQSYNDNTNVLVTEIENESGTRIRITDFCPRFEQFGRMYRPPIVIRIVEPVSEGANIRVVCNPVDGWKKNEVRWVRGNAHLRWDIRRDSLRLLTDVPITYITDNRHFHITEKAYFVLSWGFSIEEEVKGFCERYLFETESYWRTWVKHCTIPTLFQKETIRSALTLKLHCYEDTGALLAALTTSLPEELGSTRNWDYRFCWLRDAYFFLSAFRNLGHFEEMEGFLKFLLNVVHTRQEVGFRLAPVYALDNSLPLPEKIHENWAGYSGSAPVRSNNQAAEHTQNDVYGEMVLTLSPIFLDERFAHLRTKPHEHLLATLLQGCVGTLAQPDAGLWELRNGWRVHTFSNVMNLAGLRRGAKIWQLGFMPELDLDFGAQTKKALAAVQEAFRDDSLRNSPGDDTFDASLALLPILHFPDLELAETTLNRIEKELRAEANVPGFYYRYKRADDFGHPQSAFLICSFWIAQAYARLGNRGMAMKALTRAIDAQNHLGLFSEHFHVEANRQLGNFPQVYSHVGLINAAFEASPSWNEVL